MCIRDRVREIGHRLEGFEIDGVLDSGVIEQLTEEKWYSPFPQFQTTAVSYTHLSAGRTDRPEVLQTVRKRL